LEGEEGENMARKLHFKSKKTYLNWLRHNWGNPKVRKEYMGKPPHSTVYIGGKKHNVKHGGRK
jgi:hypothetical protein